MGRGGRDNSRGAGRRESPRVQKAYREVVDEIIDRAQETGELPWNKPWNTMGALRNAISGRPYRGINIFYLSLIRDARGYDSTRWLTYKQAEEESFQQWRKEKGLGDSPESRKQYAEDPEAYRGVRKGERGTTVISYFPVELKDDDGNPVLDADGKPRTGRIARSYKVWNADQTDLHFESDAEERDDASEIQSAEDILRDFEGAPPVVHGGDVACYVPGEDVVRMPPRERFHSDEHYYRALFHEMIHATGHDSRTGRCRGEWSGMGSDSYAEEELVAEIGASMLAARAGIIEGHEEHSAAYLRSWLRRFQDDPSILVRAATKAQSAVDHILGTKFEYDKKPLDGQAA